MCVRVVEGKDYLCETDVLSDRRLPYVSSYVPYVSSYVPYVSSYVLSDRRLVCNGSALSVGLGFRV